MPMVLVLEGIEVRVSEVQPEKASSPMNISDADGSEVRAREVQP